MITQETAATIWSCYREIEVAQKLLDDMQEAIKKGENSNPRDVFGRQRGLQLGVPSGADSYRLFDVKPTLAISVIRAHIAAKQSELATANEQALVELAG